MASDAPDKEPWTTTVGVLLERLSEFDPDAAITFGSTSDGRPLEFYRVKPRGPNEIQIELRDLDLPP